MSRSAFDSSPLGTAEVVGDRVRVAGEIDMSNALSLRLALEKASRRADDRLTVDMTETRYLDSFALSVLWQFLGSQPLEVRVRRGSPVEKLLRMTGFDKVAVVSIVED